MPLPRKAIVRSTPSRVRSSPDDYVNRLNGLDVVQHCLLTGLLPAVSRGPRQTRVRSERRTRATARTSNVNASHNQTYMDRLAPEEYFISTIPRPGLRLKPIRSDRWDLLDECTEDQLLVQCRKHGRRSIDTAKLRESYAVGRPHLGASGPP